MDQTGLGELKPKAGIARKPLPNSGETNAPIIKVKQESALSMQLLMHRDAAGECRKPSRLGLEQGVVEPLHATG